MKLKCGRNEYNLTQEDRVMYNGSCYQLITRGGGYESILVVAKSRAEKLIKEGLLKEVERKKEKWVEVVYYSI